MTTDIDTATTDLTKLDRVALARALRELPVEEWNAAVAAARRAQPYWRADLSSANLRSANLRSADLSSANLSSANLYSADLYSADLRSANLYSADLSSANLYSADLRSADLSSADLRSANLRSANLSSANLGDHKLTGRAAWIGEVSGYPVLLLATEGGHVLRAGCWTGVLDDAVERAFEEDESRLVRAEAEAVVAHGRAVLAAWTEADA